MFKFLHQKTTNNRRQDTDCRLLEVYRVSQNFVQLTTYSPQSIIPRPIESMIPKFESSELCLQKEFICDGLVALGRHVLNAGTNNTASDIVDYRCHFEGTRMEVDEVRFGSVRPRVVWREIWVAGSEGNTRQENRRNVRS